MDELTVGMVDFIAADVIVVVVNIVVAVKVRVGWLVGALH